MAPWPASPASSCRWLQPLSRNRRAALWLAALAVLLRVLVPVGFMPAPAAAGTSLALVLCTGHGPVTVLVDATGKEVPPQDGAAARFDDRHPCPFAGVAAGPVPPATAPLPLRRWQVAPAATVEEPQQAAGTSPAMPPPATAPPVSV